MSEIDRVTGLVGYSGVKVPVDVSASTNITLSGEQTIDGVTTSASRVLLTGQTDQKENGIWISDTGDWSRSPDCDGPYDLRQGSIVNVYQGSANFGFWQCTTANSVDIETDNITFARVSLTLATVSAYWQTVLATTTAAAARTALQVSPNGARLINGQIVRSVGAGALTAALKTLSGADPSASDPVIVVVPTVTGGVQDGGFAVRSVTSAVTFTLSSGSTTGHQSAVASGSYFYLLDNAGAIELGISSKFFGGASVQSSTAEGGAGGADSQSVLYSTAARSGVAAVCVSRWKSTQATAGTWAATTGEVQLYPFPYKSPKVTKVTATGTFTKDWDTLWLELYAKGGGGSGGGSSSGGNGGGGGEGEEGWRTVDQSTFDPSLTVTIGAAAVGIALNTNAGGNTGVTTSIGTLLTAAGGLGGTQGNNGGSGGEGGTGGASGDIYMKGGRGQAGADSSGAAIAINSAGGGKGGGAFSASGAAQSGGGGGGGSIGAGSGGGGAGVARITEHYNEGA